MEHIYHRKTVQHTLHPDPTPPGEDKLAADSSLGLTPDINAIQCIREHGLEAVEKPTSAK